MVEPDLPAGTRVRLNGRCAWPERRGCVGTVVEARNGSGVYPDDPRDTTHVIVLLDDDPFYHWARGDRWSCAVDRACLDVLEEAMSDGLDAQDHERTCRQREGARG